ncbi:MAG: hypothetical protein EU531_03890 [Promethearchaeota archaeon]|nr:MAG: hypothetical protein EU531_03890 [Candidatus Lokiarchaeota archaeon]
MKNIENYWKEIKKALINIDMTLSDEEENELFSQFNEEEKYIFQKVLDQMDGIDGNYSDMLNGNNETSIKKLLSLLLNNPNFIENLNRILLKKTIE